MFLKFMLRFSDSSGKLLSLSSSQVFDSISGSPRPAFPTWCLKHHATKNMVVSVKGRSLVGVKETHAGLSSANFSLLKKLSLISCC